MHFWSILAVAHSILATTILLQLDDITYFSPDTQKYGVSIGSPSGSHAVLPTTYLERVPLSVDDLKKEYEELLNNDDVFSKSFLSSIALPPRTILSEEIRTHLELQEIKTFISSSNITTPSGPYFLHPSGHLTRVYRLYVDYNMAFTQGVTEDQHGQYKPCVASAGESINAAISIPVPSRHYYPKPSPKRPLSGMRLGVKDIFNLKGIKTGAGSRAFFDLYPPANETATSLQLLIDMGAVVVGKLKTTQFALSETPTAEYVDQFAPFNPRGDGYQSPSASSCGTAAALASYDWLDLGTATDTGGSIRMPSAVNGLFGMRITNASLPLDGIVPITAKMDTPGLIARDAKLLQTVYKTWFEAKSNYTSFPKRILLPDEFWPSPNKTYMPIFDKFIEDISALLGAEVEHINTNQSFIQHTSYEKGLEDFQGLFNIMLTLDQWHAIGEPFILAYQQRFNRYPFLNPVPRIGLSFVPNIDPQTYEEAVRRLQVYKEWYTSKIISSCEDSLVLYPIGPGVEAYRDQSLNKPSASPIPSYVPTLQASAAGLPDYTIPIGFRKYTSKVSLREEELPVSVGIIGGAGCDHMLLDLIVKLGEEVEGFKTRVETGTAMQ